MPRPPAQPAWLAPGYGGTQVPPGFREAVEAACNTEVAADRRIDVRVLPRDAAFAIPDNIRTATNLVPPEVKDVRIIDIVGLDQQADGGTHVASSRQVGGIQVVKIENKGNGFPPGPHPGHRPRPRADPRPVMVRLA
jgi:Ser-tRNA(Ala) deacylase AlaX